jgi:antitoxin component of RelBE/YafQ-DinJ toxin-antitoxin module
MRNSISIRLSEAMEEDLKNIAQSSGLTTTDLIRIATSDYIIKVRKEGGINIPVHLAESGATYGTTKEKKK